MPPSPDLSCPHFGTCGGCSCLDTPLNGQREQKRARVTTTLAAFLPPAASRQPSFLAFTDTPVRPPSHDRQRALYPAQQVDGALCLGLYRQGTHELVRIESCTTQHPALTAFGTRAEAIFARAGIPAYDEATHRGCLRALAIRICASTGQLSVGIVTATPTLPQTEALIDALRTAAEDLPADDGPPVRLTGIVHNRNEKPGNALIGAKSTPLWGDVHLIDAVDGLRFRVHFESFYQLHRRSDELLYRPALEMLGPVAGKRVVDGFGGVGTFSLRLRRAGAATIDLVETHPQATRDAATNVTANDLDGIHVHRLPFEAFTPEASPDLVVVDPTRAGLRPPGCAALEALAAPEVLYVACGLPALARDLPRLPGYRLVDLRLADLFPHTNHVETLALLRHRDSPDPSNGT